MAEVQPIALQVQAPQLASPISTIGSLMQLRGGMADLALKQQQTQQSIANTRDIEQQTALRQRQVADSNTLQDAMKDPDAAGKLAAGDYSPVQGKVSPAFLQTIEKARLENVEKRATLSEAQLKLNDSMHTELGKSLDGVLHTARGGDDSKPADPALLDQLWQGARQHLVTDAGYKPDTLPQHIQSEAEANQVAALNNASQSLNGAALTRKGELQKIAASGAEQTKNEADAALAAAKTPGATAESQMAQRKADLQKQAVDQFQANPQAGGAVIDSVLPASLDKTSNTAYHAAYQAAMQNGGPDAAQKVIEAAASHAALISPEHVKQEVGKAVSVAQATAPIEISKAIQVEKAKAAMAGGIGQIVDPQQRNEASRTLDAADKEAIDKIAAANSLKNTVNLALAGNKVAPNLETIEELRSIVNRVNGQELKSVGSSGDAYDKVKGFLESWTAGQPIPDNIQKDFLAVADAQQKVAQTKHSTAYATVGQRFGVKDLQAPDIAGIYEKASGNPTTPKSQSEYNALPAGSKFMKPGDQTVYTKQ